MFGFDGKPVICFSSPLWVIFTLMFSTPRPRLGPDVAGLIRKPAILNSGWDRSSMLGLSALSNSNIQSPFLLKFTEGVLGAFTKSKMDLAGF